MRRVNRKPNRQDSTLIRRAAVSRFGSTSILEGLNSLVQAAKAKARGYRSYSNLCASIYLLAGKLQFNLPT